MVHITNWDEMRLSVIDSYSQSKRDASVILNAVNEGAGQSFTSPLLIIQLTDTVFYLRRNAAFVAPGAIVARLYVATGAVGTTAIPTGAVLATSTAVPAANLATTWRKTVFNFPAPYTLQPEHDYVIVVALTNCPAGAQVEVGIDSAGTHPGNECDSLAPPAWVPHATQDCCFYLFNTSGVVGGVVDISDRWGRQLGQIDLFRYMGAPVGPLNPIDVTGIIAGVVDVTDRWARQLGQIDLARVLGVALTAANPVIAGIYDAAGNRMPSMDVAARPGFVDTINRWARQLGLVDISRVLGAALTPANPVITGLYDAAGNRMPSMDVAARSGFQDVIDRAARLLGIVYGETAQLQQITPADALSPANSLEAAGFLHVYDAVAGDWNRWIQSTTHGVPQVQDTGVNTNPERYIQTNKFSSIPIDRAGGVATLLYGLASPVAHRRTAGLSTTIWWIYFYNHSGGAATVWLEAPLGTVMSGTVQLADTQGVMLQVKPLDIGDNDIYVNASADNVQAQIGGVEV